MDTTQTSSLENYKKELQDKFREFQKDPESFKDRYTESQLEEMAMDMRTLKIA